MGYDVTLHAISKEEFRHFFAEVIDKEAFMQLYMPRFAHVANAYRYNGVLAQLIRQLTLNEEKQRRIENLYSHFPDWLEKVRANTESFERTFSFGAAVLAGFLHPHWYLRNTGISWLCLKDSYFASFVKSITSLAPEYFEEFSGAFEYIIMQNYQGGGYIEHEQLEAFEHALTVTHRDTALAVLGGEDGLATMLRAVRYSKEAGTCLLEATDVMVPGEYYSDFDQLRAFYLHNEDDFRNMRECACSSLEEALRYKESACKLVLSERSQPGPLPEEIGQLSGLRGLFIHEGYAVTELPASIARLQQLERLEITGSPLTALPEEIGELSHLRVLSIKECPLQELPSSVCQLRDLCSLWIDDTRLQTLPEDIGQLKQLRSVSLRRNNLQILPDSIGQWEQIYALYLDDNALQTLPESIGQLKSLGTLSLQQNLFQTLPECLFQLDHLSTLDLSHNQITTLPECESRLDHLYKLYLSHNQLTTLPEHLRHLPKLEKIYLKGNQFTRAEKIRLNKVFGPNKLMFSKEN